ncbi:MAG: phosphate ABC transporter substrate-binding protein PstS [bacterium]|jgi:phosphate transport system substrate-binding protein|nr:phosphate ABC transporter substrate-binding protein PstS [Spartobacteria bacterium]
MKFHSILSSGLTLLATGLFVQKASAQQISGAGATFPAPLYQRWSVEFNKIQPAVKVNYQSVGSGAGVKNFIQGVVDFGASDAAMSDQDIAKVPKGVVMVPATAGEIVFAYNLPGVKDIKLTREVMAGIYLGTVTKWNDPAIVKENPSLTLPNLAIQVAYRSDGSGTTYVFTQHLSAISPKFNDEIGTDKSVTFPAGVGGKGNEGVTALIKQSPGTIGYVEYGYAKDNGLSMAMLQNKSGNFIAPNIAAGRETLANVKLPENLRVWPVDPEGAQDYPIVSFTWLLCYKKYAEEGKLKALKDFINWSLVEGQKFSEELGYIPLPESVVEKSKAALGTIQ